MNIGKKIEEYLVASRIHEEKADKERKFYVSDMGKCYRIRFLKRKGITSEFANFVYWTFQLGDMIHEFGYKALEAQGLLVSTEEYLSDEHFIGKYDGRIKTDEGKTSIFDFKSANPYKIKKLEAGGDDGEDDAMQVLMYYEMFKKEHPETAENLADIGTVVYINKEPGEKVTTTFAIDKVFHYNLWKARIKDDKEKMINFWLNDEIPPCTCPAWMKPYNSYLPFCQMTEKDILKHLIQIEKGKKIVSTKEGVKII